MNTVGDLTLGSDAIGFLFRVVTWIGEALMEVVAITIDIVH